VAPYKPPYKHLCKDLYAWSIEPFDIHTPSVSTYSTIFGLLLQDNSASEEAIVALSASEVTEDEAGITEYW
jgi:hypothetical protein